MVANLPYNITSDALKRMLSMGDYISDLILMVQVRFRRYRFSLPVTPNTDR